VTACGNHSSGTVSGAPKPSGPVALSTATADTGGEIAVDATHVYWTMSVHTGCPSSWMFCDRTSIHVRMQAQ
jgi:hypothetical protein